MADIPMKRAVIGSKTYEIVDEYARENIGENKDILMGLYPVESASGDIAVIHDGADDLPVRDLSVAIEPVQGFNGYDKPWAGGAGKNLLPIDNYNYTSNGITFTKNADGTIKATGTATAIAQTRYKCTLPSGGNYKFCGCPAGGGGSTYDVHAWDYTTGERLKKWDGTTASASDYGAGFQEIQVPEGHEIGINCRIMSGQTVNNITFKPMIVKSSETDATYEPYSNICPISGWSAVKVARTSRNLLPVTAVTTTLYGVTFTVDDRGAVTAVGTSTPGNKSVLDYGHAYLRPGTYILSGCPAGGTDDTYRLRLGIGSYAGDALTVERGGGREFTITEPMDLYARIYVQPAAGAVNQTWFPMICLADDFATWTPSEAEVEDITLPTTVYGGTLDVTKGILTVDRGFVTWNGTEEWTLSGGKKVRCNIYALQSLIKRPASASEVLEGLQASYLTAQTDNSTYQGTIGISCQTNGVVGITLTGEATTVDAVKAYLAEHPLQVVYPLATPQTYTLTSTEVKTLLGENRIYADAGQVTVQYRVDFNAAGLMYIPKAPTADGSYRLTADVNGGTPTYRWEAAE